MHLPTGGVHIRRISTIGISVRGYCTSDSTQSRSNDMRKNMMELDNLENM